ncbi:hypothetical protein EMCG_02378 [[Emmonsia] crescens]|uniref:GP-PDE domain-containing protein n=1 Tax=[Emmonsia] crescens TaxID=73230 RepID=A0A0G2HYP8_9EURO|nr:hypothetical protein EMCG_02378 [Emmonsia crescens UAMH 3008]
MDAETPILENVMATLQYSLKARRPTSPSSPKPLEKAGHFPQAPWVDRGRNKDATRAKPFTIAHRGFKAKYPENTMSAFTHAIRVGAQGLETDVHLSRDGEIVLSHDATLQRCFGVKKRIIDCDWQYISSLRTTREPFEPMPRLVDLLRYISTPERKHVWLLLDIKLDNHPETIMRAIADLLHSIPSEHRPWNKRIIIGCWTAEYLSLCHTYLPSFPVSLISYSLIYARKFLQIPNIFFNIKLKALMGPGGARFLEDAKMARQKVFAWTVNDESFMRWSIRHTMDGVVTDNSELFQRICDGWRGDGYDVDDDDDDEDEDDGITVLQHVNILIAGVILYVLGSMFATVHQVDLKEFLDELYDEYEK